MKAETINLLVMIGTLVSALSAAVAAIASWVLVGGWRKQVSYEGRRNAVTAWMSQAALFQGILKRVYLSKVEWPKDKEMIEFVSSNFFELVSRWPAVHASLSGDPKRKAEALWGNVFSRYNGFMGGSSTLSDLSDAVTAIYNDQDLKELASAKG